MRAVFRALGHGRLKLLPDNQVAIVSRYMTDFITGVRDVVRPYPPVPPPPNRYVRTGLLGRSWRVTPVSQTSGGLSVRLINDTRYAKFVQGNYQQWYHARTGWKVLSDYEDRQKYRNGLIDIYRGFRIGEG